MLQIYWVRLCVFLQSIEDGKPFFCDEYIEVDISHAGLVILSEDLLPAPQVLFSYVDDDPEAWAFLWMQGVLACRSFPYCTWFWSFLVVSVAG